MRKQVLAVTIGVLLVLSVFSVLQLWQIKPAQASLLTSSGWEAGEITDGGTWGNSSSSNRLTVGTSNPRSGTYDLVMNDSAGSTFNAYVNTSFSSQTNLYIGLDWYVSALPTTTAQYLNIFGMGSSSYSQLFNIGLVYNGSGAIFRLWDEQYNYGTNQTNGEYVLANSWYRLVFNGSSTPSDKVSLWANGSIVVTSTWLNSGTNQFIAVRGGAFGTAGVYGVDYAVIEYIDNVMIGTAYVDVSAWTTSNVPTFIVESPSTTETGVSCHFACNISDNIGVSGYVFGTNNTGHWVNETWTTLSDALSAWANVTKTLNTTAGHVIQYRWWANDTDNNNASSSMQSLTTDSGTYYLTINSLPVAVTYTINGSISGASVTAVSGSPSDIQTAIATIIAAGGGTVYIPAGTFTFNPTTMGTVNITFTNVPINIIGAGIGITILQETINPESTSMFKRTWSGQNYNGSAIRISGISFIGLVVNESITGNNAIRIVCTQDFRIDHCAFQDFEGSAISLSDDTGGTYKLVNRGIIDHCSFDNPYKDAWLPHNSSASTWAVWGYGIIIVDFYYVWPTPISDLLGVYYATTTYSGLLAPQPTYIENCNFSRCRHALSANGGGCYVSRYNYYEKASAYGQDDAHGHSGNPSYPWGTRFIESYSNVYNFTDESYSGGQDAAVEPRGGGGVCWNNTVILNPSYGTDTVQFSNDGEVSPYDVRYFYIWNNTAKWINGTAVSFNSKIQTISGVVEGTNYFLRQPDMTNDSFTYTPYTYPHPLAVISSAGSTNSTIALTIGTYSVTVISQTVSGGYTYNFSHWQDASTSTTIIVSLTANATVTATYVDVSVVTVVLSLPSNSTYDTHTISVSFTASGGTIDKKWWNVKNGTSWVYASNQTYPDFEIMTGFVNGTQYTLYAFANNTDGIQGQATVMFSVEIPLQPTGGTNSLIVNTWWSMYW